MNNLKASLEENPKSQDSLVGIPTDYELDGRGSNPGGGWEFFSSTPCPDRLWGPPNPLAIWCRGLCPWG
jgi:hypothetical protein